MQSNNSIQKKMRTWLLFTGIFLLSLGGVFAQYHVEIDEWHGADTTCPDQSFNVVLVHEPSGARISVWSKEYGLHAYGGSWPWYRQCRRTMSTSNDFMMSGGSRTLQSISRDTHHTLLNSVGNEIGTWGVSNIGPYSYIFIFPQMLVQLDYGSNNPLWYYEDVPFMLWKCEGASCTKVWEELPYECYKVTGDYWCPPWPLPCTPPWVPPEMVNGQFLNHWEDYRKRFEQYTLTNFSSAISGTTATFNFSVNKKVASGRRDSCAFCPVTWQTQNTCDSDDGVLEISGPNCDGDSPSCDILETGTTTSIAPFTESFKVPCTTPGATCGSLHCNPASGACVQCTEDLHCETNQVCDPNTFQCVEVCPAECLNYDKANYPCGTLPPTCCSNPNNGCTAPKAVCGNLDKGTQCAQGGVCNTTTWQCECPDNCRISPNDVACGAQLVPSACLPHASVCQSYWQGSTIGWKCNDIDTRCANNPGAAGNNIKCWSPDEVGCGTSVVPFSGVPAQINGLYCDAYSDERHGLCDSGSDSCLSVVQGAAVPSDLPNLYLPKFRFDVGVDPDSALWYNLWFKFRFAENPGESFPQIMAFDSADSKTGLYCFNCSVQPDPISAFKINYDSAASKEGLVRFNIQNQQLFGPNNYARIKIFDRVNPGKTSGIVPLSDSSKTDYAILKLDAGSSGECVSEDRQFIGKTGPPAVPSVKLAWNWSAIDVNSCVSNAASGFFCDSTQFLMSVIDRLENNYQFEARNIGSPLAYDFNANLIKDGFSTDFLLDFDHYMMGVNFYDTPQSYKDNWHKYLQESLHLHFQVIGQSSAQRLDSPGKYTVHIDRGMPNSFFTPLGEPAADVIITLEKLLDPDPPHPLYWVAFDGSVGATKRQGETVIGRDNYGSHFAGDVLAISGEVAGYSQGNALSLFNAEAKTTFLQTNEISQRGKLFELALPNGSTPGTAVISSVSATPVAMKIVSLNNSGQGFFLLQQTNQDVSVPQDQSIGSWSGIAGSPNACRGFNNQPPLFLKADEVPNETACTANADSRGFLWLGTAEDEKAVLESVLYAPTNQSTVLVRQCQVGTSYLSPDSWLPAENSQIALPLGYSQTQEWNTNTLTQIVDLVKEGKVCQFVGSQNDLHYFWNRKALLDELPNATHWADFAENGDVEICTPTP
ncbi:MAG: hypothetical protein V1777_02090 [Candidatus Micrarchaeota archaeon]